jgi:ATP-dependent Lon protease
VVALTALITGCNIRTTVALTGEINLDGRVTKVGRVPTKAEAVNHLDIRQFYAPVANIEENVQLAKRRKVGRVTLVGYTQIDTVLRSLFVKGPSSGGEARSAVLRLALHFLMLATLP